MPLPSPTLELNAVAQALLDNLPAYHATSLYSTTALNALGAELGRIQDFLDTVQLGFFPQNADDTYGMLSLWEVMLELPVAPSALTLATRQARVLGTIYRQVGAGSDWGAALTTFLGSSDWSVQENFPLSSEIEVLIPSSSSFSVGQVTQFLRAITPAHLGIVVGNVGGFIVDVSDVDAGVIE